MHNLLTSPSDVGREKRPQQWQARVPVDSFASPCIQKNKRVSQSFEAKRAAVERMSRCCTEFVSNAISPKTTAPSVYATSAHQNKHVRARLRLVRDGVEYTKHHTGGNGTPSCLVSSPEARASGIICGGPSVSIVVNPLEGTGDPPGLSGGGVVLSWTCK